MTTFHAQLIRHGSAGGVQVCQLLEEEPSSASLGQDRSSATSPTLPMSCPLNPNRCYVSGGKHFNRVWVCCLSGNMHSPFLLKFDSKLLMGQIPMLQTNMHATSTFVVRYEGRVFSLMAPSRSLQCEEELRAVGQWSQPGRGGSVGLDVVGLRSSWVRDRGERTKGWYRIAHEVVEGCEIAETVPSGRGQSPLDGCGCLFTSAAV